MSSVDQNPIMPPLQSENNNPNQNHAQSPVRNHKHPDLNHDHSVPIQNVAPVCQPPLRNRYPCYFRPAIYFSSPLRDYCDIWVMFDTRGTTTTWKTECLPTHSATQYRPPTHLWLHWLSAWVVLGPILFQCNRRKCRYVLGTVVSGEHAYPPLCFLFVNYCSADPPADWSDHFRALPLLPNHA